MGKASSSKKVARAAGTGGGRTARARTPWTYSAVIVVIVVIGVLITWTSRSRYENQLAAATNANASVAPTVGGTPWYEGYAVDICGTFAEPIDKPATASGISTAGNGVITIAPKKKRYAGKNATLGVFAHSVGLTLGTNEIGLPGGRLHVNGDDCGSQPAKLYVKEFPFVGAPGALQTNVEPTSVLLANDALVTLAFVPASQKGSIPAPPKSVQDALTKITTPSTTTTTTPSTSTTTGGSSSTTSTTSRSTAKRSTTKRSTAKRSTTSSTS
jgi:hypothetical protein